MVFLLTGFVIMTVKMLSSCHPNGIQTLGFAPAFHWHSAFSGLLSHDLSDSSWGLI